MKKLFVIGSVSVLMVASCQNPSEKKATAISAPVATATATSPTSSSETATSSVATATASTATATASTATVTASTATVTASTATATMESSSNVTTTIALPATLPKRNWSIKYQKNKMFLMGKEIPFDDLTTALTDTFVKIAKIGGNLPKSQDFKFEFDENALMGVRGEIKSSVEDAREAAMIRTIATADKPEIMAKNFYALYTDVLNRTGSPMEKKILNASISDALAKSLAAAKNMDADYFLKAQDVGEDWDNTVTIPQVAIAQNKASLTVKMGAKNMKTAVLVELVKNKNVWVIDKVSASK